MSKVANAVTGLDLVVVVSDEGLGIRFLVESHDVVS